MSSLTCFIIVIVAITFQFTLYTIKRLKEPFEPRMPKTSHYELIKNTHGNYWKNAEITNGRLAMLGLLALTVNYGLFGGIIPGFF